ncbi:MAG: FAD-binding oxidoreductase [Proteobacteria bacterium]|nr:FAD-binding oxidoreductase [Pseudomonadota bacterium]
MYSPADDSKADADTPYVAYAGKPLDLPRLQDDTRADLVIVGGGIAGCSAALHAAEAGAKVVLVEAMTIGWGASSRNSGHLPPATKHEPDEIIRRYGRVYGERILNTSDTAPQVLADLTKKHNIDCNLRLGGHLTGAHMPERMEFLEKRVDYWRKRGRPLEMLDRDQFAKMTGTEFYFGGALDHRGGSINPLAYVRGLACAAIKAGAQLFEHSRAIRLEREGSEWCVTTPAGSVRAKNVFLFTNAYTDDLWPGLRTSVVPVRVLQFYTKPLSSNLRQSILPGRQPMIDTHRVMHAVRVHDDGRLHYSIGARMRPGSAPTPEKAMMRLRELYPNLGDLDGGTWWAGWMAFNEANSWKMHNPEPGLYAALGCNGRGVMLATMYGRDLARLLSGARNDDLCLPLTAIKHVPFHSFSVAGVSAVRKWYRMQDDREDRRVQHLKKATS